jgi:lipopolysaccharide export system protein LptA
MKKIIFLIFTILLTGFSVIASDFVIQSDTQSYNDKENKIKAEGNVRVDIDDGKVMGDKADITVTKDNKLDVATFYDNPYAVQVKGFKKREVKANILKVSLINKTIKAEGNTQTTVFDGEEPIVVITSDSQEYEINDNKMTAQGNVMIKYNDLETFSQKAVIKTGQNGELKNIDLIGKAKIKKEQHNSSADVFSYSALTEELIAKGNVISETEVDDGSIVTLKSKYQEYNQKSNTFIASGNVKINYKDYFAQGPKVVCYPDKESGKPNEIYFVGRSAISQNVKTIYADKIKMVLKPKTFYAEGNTKTVIKNLGTNSNKDLF